MSEYMFDFCQFKVKTDIKLDKQALQEIKNLNFEIEQVNPLILSRNELSADIFLKLTETLKKCSPFGPISEELDSLNSHFSKLSVEDDNVKKYPINTLHTTQQDNIILESTTEQSIISHEIENLNFALNKPNDVSSNLDLHNEKKTSQDCCEKQLKEILDDRDKYHKANEALGAEICFHKSNNSAPTNHFDSANSSCSVTIIEDKGEITEPDIERVTLEDDICKIDDTKTQKEGNEITGRLMAGVKNAHKNETMNKIDKKKEKTMYLSAQDETLNNNSNHYFETASLVNSKSVSTSKSMSQDIFPCARNNIESCNDLKTDNVHYKTDLQEVSTIDYAKEFAGVKKQISHEKVTQADDAYRNDFERKKGSVQQKHHLCESADSEFAENYIIPFNERDFKAAKYYFKNSLLRKFFENENIQKNRYVVEIKINKKDQKKYYEILKNFTCFSLNNIDETIAFIWQNLIKEEYSRIKTLYEPRMSEFFIMGPKEEVSAARSFILKIRGNRDEEMIWTKPSEETKTLSSGLPIKECKKKYSSTSMSRDFDKSTDSSSESESYFPKERIKKVENIDINHKAKLRQSQSRASHSKPSKLEEFKELNLKQIGSKSKELTFDGNNLIVKIFMANITTLDVDIIVNAASRHLLHKSGVSSAIAQAAGSKLQKECEDFIQQHKALEVTHLFVSSGGNLKARKVMHAVGPKWDLYEDKKKCLQDLRHTVLKCLLEASRLGATKIALPSISAAVFKVPANSCAKNYMTAVKHFDCIKEKLQLTSLQEIMFVDVNDDMVKRIQETFFTEWELKPDEDLVKKDLMFAKQYLDKQEHMVKKMSGAKPKEYKHSSSSSRVMGTKGTEKGKTYEHDLLKIIVSNKPALTSSYDVVIVLGDTFQQISGLQDCHFKKESSSTTGLKSKHFKFYSASSPGKSSKQICCCNCNTENKDNVEIVLNYLASKGLSRLCDKEEFVITSKLLYPGIKSNIKLVSSLAESFHEFIRQVSKAKRFKCIRITTSEDAIPNIIKVFDSKEDLKPIELEGLSDTRQRKQSHSTSRQVDYHQSYKRSSTNDENEYPENVSAAKPSQYDRNGTISKHESHVGSSVDDEIVCTICYNLNGFSLLPCCKNKICGECLQRCDICPFCRQVFKIIIGNQPSGKMEVEYLNYEHAAGFEKYATWLIMYNFFSGFQKESHPNPGKPYFPLSVKTYLPDTKEGYGILLLLKIAFLRRLTFTIGQSLTRNKEDVIIWNGIHHKTSLREGSHGYPDPGYLTRVAQELSDKGVTFESLTEEERFQLDRFKTDMECKKNYLRYPTH